MNELSFDKLLDAKGLFCPEPVMLLHAEVNNASQGDVIKVEATDPSTKRDIPKFCSFLGHKLISQSEENQLYYYWIQVN